MNRVDAGYESLSTAIIKMAVNDYENGRNLLKSKDVKKQIKGEKLINDVKRFFHSKWFIALSKKADGPETFKKIEENYETYGKCIPDEDDLNWD